MRKDAERVKVRGTCAAGHVTETYAQRRRTTWSGTCSTPECELNVNCRRLPAADQGEPKTTTATLPSGTKVRRVRSYGRRDDAGTGVATDDGAGDRKADDDTEHGVGEESQSLREPGFGEGKLEPKPEYESDELIPGLGF